MEIKNAEANPAPTKQRIEALDLFRGVAAMAAVGIHTLQLILNHTRVHSPLWTVAGVLNRLLLFAVPSFLLLTTILLTRKLLKDYNLKEYYQKRIHTALAPYLLWSIVYTLLASRIDPKFSWHEATTRVLTGKSYYHLYFLGVILQLYIVLPLLVPLFRRRPPMTLLLPILILLEMGFYWLNRRYLNLPYLGSVIAWYIVTLGIGMWLGSRTQELSATVKRWMPVTGGLALFFGIAYLPYALDSIALRPDVDTLRYQIFEWGYTNSAGLFLLGVMLTVKWNEKLHSWLLSIGGISMQMYLLHRFPVWIMDRLHYGDAPLKLVLSMLITLALSIAFPIFVAKRTEKTRLSLLLFGR